MKKLRHFRKNNVKIQKLIQEKIKLLKNEDPFEGIYMVYDMYGPFKKGVSANISKKEGKEN